MLLVEDEEDLRQTLAEWLRELGYHVLDAPGGAAALQLLGRDGRADMLVADMGLLDGRQLADAACGRRLGLPVLFHDGLRGSGNGGAGAVLAAQAGRG